MVQVPGARARGPQAQLRQYAVAWAYLGCFVLVQVSYAFLDPHAQAAFVGWSSTSVANLEHHPVACLIVSAFVVGGGWGAVTWLPVIAIAMFGAVDAVGNRRAAIACVAGQLVGTLVSEGIVAWRVSSGALPAAYRNLIDVGPSYVVVSAAVVALLCGTWTWRVLAAVDLLLLAFPGRIFAGLTQLDVSAVGHLTAIITAAASVPLLRRPERRKRPLLRRQPPRAISPKDRTAHHPEDLSG